MEPINYSQQVLDPIMMALDGAASRLAEQQAMRQMDQQDVALGQGQQRIDMAGQAMAFEQERARMADQERAAAMQAAAAEKAAAEQGQRMFADFIFSPNKTAEMAKSVVDANPALAGAVMEFWQGQNADQQSAEVAFGKQFTFALNKDPEQAKAMLEQRAERLEASGDKARADAYRAQVQLMDTGPQGVETVKAQSLAIMAGIMDPKDLQSHMEVSGYSQPEVKPLSEAAKINSDFEAGLITADQRDMQIANLAPAGMSIESDGAGGFRMVQGAGVSGSAKPFTEEQSKDVVFATRAKGALEALNPVAGALTSRLERAAEYDPTGLTRGLQSDDFQIALNAGNEFLQAILRKDTGAAITEQEQALYGTTYLPRPGDNEKLLDQKKAARDRAVKAIEAGMSPAQMVAQERALMQAAGVEPTSGGETDDAAFIASLRAKMQRGEKPTPEEAERYKAIRGGGQ